MYNSDRKTQFINELGLEGGNVVWATSVFNNTDAIESRLSKDLAEFTAEEVGLAIANNGVMSSVTISNRVPLVVRYKKWCASHGFPAVVINSDNVTVDVSGNVRDTMVYSPTQLSSILMEAFPDTNKKSSKCVYRAYLWLGFSGMTSEEAVSVRNSNVDLRNRIVNLNNRWYMIPDEGINDIKAVCKAKEFVRIMRGAKVSFPRDDGDKILRGRKLKKKITDKGYIRETLRPTVQLGFKNVGKSGMSFLKIRKSGIFYEMFRREVQGLIANFASVAYDDYVSGDYKESDSNPKQKIVRRIMLTYERDYAAWKNAFSTELKEAFSVESLP